MTLRPESLTAQALHALDRQTGAVVPPLHPATTFARDEANKPLGAGIYSRDESPAYPQVEALLTRLEEGEEALVFASGMAAAAAVVQSCRPGERILVPRVMYWSLRNWIVEFCRDWNLRLDFFDAGEAGALERAIRPGETRLVWIETPCNPTWEVIDIAAAAEAAHAAGAILAVDSTCASPVITRPLALGADIVMHSATKYLNGHSDVVAGALVTRRKDETWARIRKHRAQQGAVLGPFESWLLLRGLRTLHLRVRAASENALAIARRFEGDPRVAGVLYPGLESHPGHAVARRQMQGGFGGMLSLRVAGGAEAALATLGRCRVFLRATSLGGVESLIEHRASVEGPESPIPEDLLRLSVGIEAVEDLIADLDQALG